MTMATPEGTTEETVDLLAIFETLDEDLVRSFSGLQKNANNLKSSSRRKITLTYGLEGSIAMVEIVEQLKKFAQQHDLVFAHPSDDMGSWGIYSNDEIIGSITITNDTHGMGVLYISINNML